MVGVEQISLISSILLEAAKNCTTVSYADIYKTFPEKNISAHDVFDTLEAASRALIIPRIAICSSILEKKYTGLPGSGFFDLFKNCRPDKYEEIAGHTIIQNLTFDEQFKITNYERRRVYEYVERHF